MGEEVTTTSENLKYLNYIANQLESDINKEYIENQNKYDILQDKGYKLPL